MAAKIEVEHELWRTGEGASYYVRLTMVNSRGTTYVAFIHGSDFSRIGGPFPSRVANTTKEISIRTRHAPKWVRDTIEKQLPIAAIMLL